MTKRMLIDATQPEETRVVVISGNKLEELDFEIASRKPLKGNVYLARVTRVEPSLQAAFVEYGGNRHGFLAFSEIHPDYYRIPVGDRSGGQADEAGTRESDRGGERNGDRAGDRASERAGDRSGERGNGRGREPARRGDRPDRRGRRPRGRGEPARVTSVPVIEVGAAETAGIIEAIEPNAEVSSQPISVPGPAPCDVAVDRVDETVSAADVAPYVAHNTASDSGRTDEAAGDTDGTSPAPSTAAPSTTGGQAPVGDDEGSQTSSGCAGPGCAAPSPFGDAAPEDVGSGNVGPGDTGLTPSVEAASSVDVSEAPVGAAAPALTLPIETPAAETPTAEMPAVETLPVETPASEPLAAAAPAPLDPPGENPAESPAAGDDAPSRRTPSAMPMVMAVERLVGEPFDMSAGALDPREPPVGLDAAAVADAGASPNDAESDHDLSDLAPAQTDENRDDDQDDDPDGDQDADQDGDQDRDQDDGADEAGDDADDTTSSDEDDARLSEAAADRDYAGETSDFMEGGDRGDVDEDEDEDEDEAEVRPRVRYGRQYKIQEVIKRRQILLVQVTKEERGNKGAALTTYLSLPGRYCVLMPNSDRGGGISRKISNPADRKRMKEILSELNVPAGMAVILRTAGLERNKAEIKRDFEYLLRLWENIRELTLQSSAPAVIYEEANLVKRSIRDLYTNDIDEILVEGEAGYRTAKDFMRMLMPSHAKRVQPHRDETMPLYFRYQVEAQIDAIHSPVVQLKSGGYIVLNPTEALVAIDVNSGRSTRERNIEETAVKTNLEAADEIARQLRLRDLAGLVVIDFIDMEDQRNVAAVERRLKEAMRSDRARIQLGRISTFGLLELSRQRLRPSLLETNFERCVHCSGTGMVRSTESAVLHVLRGIEEEGVRRRASEVTVFVPSQIALYILNHKRHELEQIETRYGLRALLDSDDSLIVPTFRIERSKVRAASEDAGPIINTEQVFAETDRQLEADQRRAEAEFEDEETAEPSDEPVVEPSAADAVRATTPAVGTGAAGTGAAGTGAAGEAAGAGGRGGRRRRGRGRGAARPDSSGPVGGPVSGAVNGRGGDRMDAGAGEPAFAGVASFGGPSGSGAEAGPFAYDGETGEGEDSAADDVGDAVDAVSGDANGGIIGAGGESGAEGADAAIKRRRRGKRGGRRRGRGPADGQTFAVEPALETESVDGDDTDAEFGDEDEGPVTDAVVETGYEPVGEQEPGPAETRPGTPPVTSPAPSLVPVVAVAEPQPMASEPTPPAAGLADLALVEPMPPEPPVAASHEPVSIPVDALAPGAEAVPAQPAPSETPLSPEPTPTAVAPVLLPTIEPAATPEPEAAPVAPVNQRPEQPRRGWWNRG